MRIVRWTFVVILLLVYTVYVYPQIIGPSFNGLITQANPAATTLTTIYTVPLQSMTTVTTVWVTNRDTIPHTFRIAIARNGAADNPAQYIYWNVGLQAGQALVQAVSLVLNSNDQIRVYADAQQLSFSFYGILQGQLPTP